MIGIEIKANATCVNYKPASKTWIFWSDTGVAPASPPEKTYNLSPRQAELVWYVLGQGDVPFTETSFQRDPLSGQVHKVKLRIQMVCCLFTDSNCHILYNHPDNQS